MKQGYKLELTFWSGSEDRTHYSSSATEDEQSELSSRFLYDLSAALDLVMPDPPGAEEFALCMQSHIDPFRAVAFAKQQWDAEVPLDGCVQVLVDIDKLVPSETDDAKLQKIREQLEFCGCKVTSARLTASAD